MSSSDNDIEICDKGEGEEDPDTQQSEISINCDEKKLHHEHSVDEMAPITMTTAVLKSPRTFDEGEMDADSDVFFCEDEDAEDFAEVADNIQIDDENEELSLHSVETIDIDENSDDIDDEITINISTTESEPLPVRVETSETRSIYELARSRLTQFGVPEKLPGREEEQELIYQTVNAKLKARLGGTIYISGVPGTGKTATVKAAIKRLQQDVESQMISPFLFVEINAMKLTSPQVAYSVFYHHLVKKKVSQRNAKKLLTRRFKSGSSSSPMCVLLLDELDLLVTRKQNVLYDFFDWPRYKQSGLIVIGIANQMNLDEHLAAKIGSRLGMNKISFNSYTASQLENILKSRLHDNAELESLFDQHAIKLVAMKLANSTGDARRALEIARRALEFAEREAEEKLYQYNKYELVRVTPQHIAQAVDQMFANPKVSTVRSAPLQEKLFLCSLVRQLDIDDTTECTFDKVEDRYRLLCTQHNMPQVNHSQLLSVCSSLGACRVLVVDPPEKGTRQRIRLAIERDDLNFAFKTAEDERIQQLWGSIQKTLINSK